MSASTEDNDLDESGTPDEEDEASAAEAADGDNEGDGDDEGAEKEDEKDAERTTQVPDPEPYAPVGRTTPLFRGLGYLLLTIIPFAWLPSFEAGFVTSRGFTEDAVTQRIPQAAALGLLAWWCLAIARRRETWLRRERVRATAAESAADGIPRVAEGVDPDPYPRAVLPVPVEVIAGAVLVFAAVAVVGGALTGRVDLSIARAMCIAPMGLIFGGWLLRIAQARTRYAARHRARANALAAGEPLPWNGDFVEDPQPFEAFGLGAAGWRLLQRLLILVGALLWEGVSVRFPSSRGVRDFVLAVVIPLIFLTAAGLLVVARRKEEWVFRDRGRRAILAAAETRVPIVTEELDPSLDGATFIDPESKMVGVALLVVGWIALVVAAGTKFMEQEIVALVLGATVLGGPLLPLSAKWNRGRLKAETTRLVREAARVSAHASAHAAAPSVPRTAGPWAGPLRGPWSRSGVEPVTDPGAGPWADPSAGLTAQPTAEPPTGGRPPRSKSPAEE